MAAAVDQLGALWVEPGGEPQRIGEVQVDRRVSCANRAEKGMWYQVVSPPNMPWSRAELRREGPLGDGEGGDCEGDQQGDFLHLRSARLRRSSRGAWLQPSSAASRPDRDADDDDPAQPQDAQRAEQLEAEDQQAGAERDLGEPGQGPGELRHDPAPQPVAAEPERR